MKMNAVEQQQLVRAPASPLTPRPPLPDPRAVLPTQYFGEFERENLPVAFAFPGTEASDYSFNRPNNCEDIDENITVAGDTFARPSGFQACTANNNNVAWTLFPWVAETNAAGKQPGCEAGVTVIAAETNPSFTGDVVAPPALAAQKVCQNFVAVVGPSAPEPAPAPETGR